MLVVFCSAAARNDPWQSKQAAGFTFSFWPVVTAPVAGIQSIVRLIGAKTLRGREGSEPVPVGWV